MLDDLANQLWQARQQGSLVDIAGLDLPANEEQAYALARTITSCADVTPIGYKIGATTDAAIAALGLTGSFHGPLFEQFCHASGEAVRCFPKHKVIVESEIAVKLARDLPHRDAQYSAEEVSDAAEWICPAMELVATRFAIELKGNGILLIADSGVNMDFVHGDKATQLASTDLTQHAVTLRVNDEALGSGHSGMSIWGNPLLAVGWLANHDTLEGVGLKAGEFITTGTCTGMVPVKIGDRVVADFGSLGNVTAYIVAA